MADNPFVVVGSPNYAGPLVNWFGGVQKNQQQGRQQQQPSAPQAQPQWPSLSQLLSSWNAQQPGTAGSVAGANTMTSGVY